MNVSINTSSTSVNARYNNDNSIVFSAILATIVFVFQIMNIGSVVSICFYVSIALVAMNYIFKILATKRMSTYVLVIAVLMLLSFAISGFVLDFEVYKRAIIVMCCVICIADSRTSNLNLKQIRIIEFCFIFAVAFANFMFYFGGYNTIFYYDTNSIAMNFSNPNALAIWLAMFLIALLICFSVEQNKLLKLLLFASAASLLPIILATESRNSLLSCILVIAALIIVMLRSRKQRTERLPNWALLIFTLLPVIVFFAYMYIISPNMDFFNDVFSFLVSQGKSLSSRAGVWQTVINYLGPCFFFGKYNLFYNHQMHNSLMTIYCMFGAPVTCLISAVFYNVIKKKNIYTQIALLGIWSTGCFETSIFTGAAGVYLMLQIIPALGDFHTKRDIS